MDEIEQDEPGFFRRHRMWIVTGVVILVAGGAYLAFSGKGESKKKSSAKVVSIMPVMPPPPPQPTPAPTPPPQQEQTPPPDVKQPEFEEEKQPDSPPQQEAKADTPEEPAPMGSNIQGAGNDGFGLRGGGNGVIGGTGTGKGKGGSKWGWYAGQVQSRVADALSKHRRTRSASMEIKVRIWADPSGRVTRAALAASTGDSALDQAIQNEVLTGLQLQEAPPADMPMPIVMRISAKRPR